MIPKELEPLAEEARKYNVEDFTRKFTRYASIATTYEIERYGYKDLWGARKILWGKYPQFKNLKSFWHSARNGNFKGLKKTAKAHWWKYFDPLGLRDHYIDSIGGGQYAIFATNKYGFTFSVSPALTKGQAEKELAKYKSNFKGLGSVTSKKIVSLINKAQVEGLYYLNDVAEYVKKKTNPKMSYDDFLALKGEIYNVLREQDKGKLTLIKEVMAKTKRQLGGSKIMGQRKRWVYGTRDKRWHLVGPEDRDFGTGISQEEMKRLGKERAKEKYLRPKIIMEGITVKPKLKELLVIAALFAIPMLFSGGTFGQVTPEELEWEQYQARLLKHRKKVLARKPVREALAKRAAREVPIRRVLAKRTISPKRTVM